MSSNYSEGETSSYFGFNNPGYNDNQEGFTDLQSCELLNDTDSQSSYSDSSDLTDEDERQVTIHFSSLTKEDIIEPNEDLNILKNKNEKNASASLPESSNVILDLIREDLYKFVFMPISKQLSNYVRCRITRNNFDLFQTFRLEIDYEDNGKSFCLLTAEKPLKIIGQTQYIISVISKFTNDCYSAELESTNATGTSYVLYDVNGVERQQLAVILYEANFLGLKGPRKIEALLPKFNHHMTDVIDENDSKEENDCFIHLHNKPPHWNPQTCCYTLQFNGKNRVTIASVKNFQMMIENEDHVEKIVMQFGRISENEFSCDFRYPLSLIQTFGIALSAFESRLFRD